jgi:hypothetical protein
MIRNHNNPILEEEDHRKLRDLVEIEADRREREAWGQVARKAREHWAKDNPY